MVSRDIGCTTLWWTLSAEKGSRRELLDSASSSELTANPFIKKKKTTCLARFQSFEIKHTTILHIYCILFYTKKNLKGNGAIFPFHSHNYFVAEIIRFSPKI